MKYIQITTPQVSKKLLVTEEHLEHDDKLYSMGLFPREQTFYTIKNDDDDGLEADGRSKTNKQGTTKGKHFLKIVIV